jgi:hypothetical protein
MKKDNSTLFTTIATFVALLQPTLPKFGEPTDMIITFALVTIAAIATFLKQKISVEVNRNALIATWVVFGVALFGGINNLLIQLNAWNPLYMNEKTQTVLRDIIVSILALLNLLSKKIFPTDAGQAIQNAKNNIKQGDTQVIQTLK